MRRLLVAILLLMGIPGCNTLGGIGKDITGVAEWTKGKMADGGYAGSSAYSVSAAPSSYPAQPSYTQPAYTAPAYDVAPSSYGGGGGIPALGQI
ncbi:hypothetical protein ACEUZ9_000318 [Paracoccus litorisediminis]|uniref:hypothetical protein n=1 Tax=Paracoccus litorisediminis TaxID=2006130 RepID=UPI003730E017